MFRSFRTKEFDSTDTTGVPKVKPASGVIGHNKYSAIGGLAKV
jgi:hypothetical protein